MNKINFEKLFELNRKINIAIVGSRDFNDYNIFKKKIDPINSKLEGLVDTIVSGGARGADTMAEIYAREKKISTIIFKPDWEKYGNSAGIIRNRIIIKNSDLVIAFLMGDSKGTKNSIKVAKELNKELFVFDLNLN